MSVVQSEIYLPPAFSNELRICAIISVLMTLKPPGIIKTTEQLLIIFKNHQWLSVVLYLTAMSRILLVTIQHLHTFLLDYTDNRLNQSLHQTFFMANMAVNISEFQPYKTTTEHVF